MLRVRNQLCSSGSGIVVRFVVLLGWLEACQSRETGEHVFVNSETCWAENISNANDLVTWIQHTTNPGAHATLQEKTIQSEGLRLREENNLHSQSITLMATTHQCFRKTSDPGRLHWASWYARQKLTRICNKATAATLRFAKGHKRTFVLLP